MTKERRYTQSSGLKTLLGWARREALWIQHLVAEVLTSGVRLTDDQVTDLADLCLKEIGLVEGTVPAVELPSASQLSADNDTQMTLTSFKHIENVNALQPNQEIEFHPRLTICYGENGSGKSGYVRVLKRVSAVRTAEPVLSNVYSRGSAGKPQARIKISIDDHEQIIDWSGEQGLEPLTHLNVFDSRVAVLHISEDLNYSYTPADLELFPLVTESIQRVQERIEEIRDARRPHVNPFTGRFKLGSQIRDSLERLEVSPHLRELLRQADLSDDEIAELSIVRKRVSELGSKPHHALLEVATQRKDTFKQVSEIGETILGFNQKSYSEAVSSLRMAQHNHEKATKQAFTGENVPGVLGDAWKGFIEAAEAYIEDLKLSEYPASDSRCIYCRQSLDDAAVALIKKYRDYCNASLRQAVNVAKTRLQTICTPLGDIQLDESERDIERLIEAQKDAGDSQTALKAALVVVQHARIMQSACKSADDCPNIPDEVKDAIGMTSASVDAAVKAIEDLKKEGVEREDALSKAETRKSELEERVLLGELIPQVREYTDTLKWIDSCDSYLQSFPRIKARLTGSAKRASSAVLNSNFQRIFKEESEALHAPNVSIDFPGRQGQSRRRKRLARNHELTEILSEGEQKIIALADFLAEVTMRPDNLPIIFDDPVTSLDHLRMEYVVSRIVQLSQTRQVMVFTHDIFFVAELLARFDRNATECSFYNVTAEDQKVGMIERGSHPRTDTFNDRKRRINSIIEEARNATGDQRRGLVEKGYEELRGACEIVAEKDLLKGVSERYRPNVRMTVLDQIRSDRLPRAIQQLLPIFNKCSRNIPSHSQPMATLGSRATLDDLKADWLQLDAVRKEYNRDN